jgi:hypothetical protein
MGFRIDKGIFQFKDGDRFINKFKIDEAGTMVEVDPESGDPVAAYMRTGDQAADADTVDGIHAGGFIRSDATDNVTGHTEWQDGYNIRLGNGADFRMWHDGSHTYFRNYNHGNGNIYFQGEDTAGANHALLYMFTANTRPYVSLYEDGGERLRTTSTGITTYGDHYVHQGRIHIKRGTGLTHTEWEDDSSANGRGQLILDSHYSDLIIASRNTNSNKHGSTLTFATQSMSTNDVAKWVIGQGQYQEGADHLAFAYGTNQTNPHSILGTDNAYADFVIMNGGKVCIGGTVDKNPYSTTNSTRLMFGGANSDAEANYYIGTNKEDYGGNYTKLDLRWHTGIRMGAQPGYGGIRFFDTEDLGNRLMSIGETDGNVRIDNNLWIGGAGGWITDLLNGKLGSTAKAADSDKLDGSHRHEIGNRDYSKQGFYVDGDPETYYPVLFSPRGGYAFNRWSISRRYNWTAPWDPIGTGNHKGGLTFDFYWTGDTAWGGNDKTIRIHQFAEQYTTMVGGIQLARTGGMIVWLRGGNAYYELQTDCGQVTIDPKLDGWVDGSGTRFDPTGDVNEYRNSIWNNYPVRGNNDLYHNGNVVATESWVDGSFLRTNEKAADSNLLDGINSTSFLRSDQNDTMSGTLTITGSNGVSRLRIEGTTPTIDLDDADGDSFYIHVNSNNFYVLSDRDGGGNYGTWEGPHPLQLEADTNSAYVFGNKLSSAAYASTSAFDAAGTGAAEAGAVNQRIEDEVLPQIVEAQNAAAAAQTTADGKLGSTAKAADANKLDGYDWMQSGKNVRANEFYADNWFRNYNSGEGIYNQATASHWYSDHSARWRHKSGSSSEAWIMLCTSNNTVRGSFYANSSNEVGILDSDNQWAVKVVRDSHVELRDNSETVFTAGQGGHSSNYGTVCTHGNGRGGWEGYSINGRFVWMSSDSSMSGMYNDTDNEWMTQYHRNGAVKLYHNGGLRLETQSGGAKVHGTCTATAFSGDGSALTNLNVPDQTVPVTINGEGNERIVSINMNLDMGQIEFALTNGQTFTAQMGR